MTMQEAGVKLVAEGESQFLGAMDRAEKSVRGFSDATEGASGKVNVAQAAITGAFTAIAGVAVEAFGRAADAVGDFVGGAIEAAADFEQQLSVLRVTSGATAEEMARVSDLSIQLGNDLTLPTTSAQDANDAILELVKGGLSLEDAMDAARGSLLLATAAETDAGEAAQITAGILNAFGLEGKEATRIVDLLAGSAAKGAGEIEDYAQGFQQAGFAFHAAGFPAEDLATSLQTLIESGLGGSDAGTALKNAMMRLQNPTKEASALMEGLGINVYDASGTMKPFPEIIGILNTQLGGMTQEQRNAALGTIFLGDGMKAMIPLLEGGTNEFNKRKSALSEVGAAEALAAAQTEGFKGAQAALQSQLETLQITLGTHLLPILTDLFANHITPAITTVMKLVDAFFAAGGGADQLAAALAPVIETVGRVVSAFQTASTEGSGAFSKIQTAVDSVVRYVEGVLGIFATFINENGAEIQAFIQGAWDRIQSIVGKAVELVSTIVEKVFNFLAQFINEHGDKIQGFIQAAWDAITGIIDTALILIEDIINIAISIINGDWDQAWKDIQKLLYDAWEGIKRIVEDAIELVKKTIDLALTFLQELFADAWEKIRKGVEDKWNEIKSAIDGKLGDIKKAAEGIVNDIVGFFNTLPEKLSAAASNAMQSLIDGLNARLGDIRGAIQGILDTIAGIDLNPFDNAQQVPRGTRMIRPPGSSGQIFGNAAGAGNTNNFTRNFNLTLNTAQASAGVMRDFAIMEALAGR